MSIILIARGRGDYPVTAFPDMESAHARMQELCAELPLRHESDNQYAVEGERVERMENAGEVLSEMFEFIDQHGDAPERYLLVDTGGKIGQFSYVD